MSSYFDSLAREVRESSERYFRCETGEPGFEADVIAIEQRLISDVTLCTGDREFPDDLRQKALGLIAQWHVGVHASLKPRNKSLDWLRSLRSSRLVEEMHSLFHEVARRRIETRFGLLFDNPEAAWKRRDAHDTEKLD